MGIFTITIIILISCIILYALRKFFNGPATTNKKSMLGKICIVTGSNTGIGKETALDLLRKNATVIFAARDEGRTMQVINSIEDKNQRANAYFLRLDLSSYDSITESVELFKNKFGTLDVLVNNAGGIFDTFNLKEGTESTTMTNHIGPVYLTALLIPLLRPEAMIVNVSSEVHYWIKPGKFEELVELSDFEKMRKNYAPWTMYSWSKLGNVLHAIHLDYYAKKNGLKFKTASLHPGVVRSDFQNRSQTFLYKIMMWACIFVSSIFFKDAKMGAQTTLHVVYSDYEKLNSGAFFWDCKEKKKNIIADDYKNVDRMMEYTKNLIFNNKKSIPSEVEKYFS
jgi:retinol dehydrogenase 12